MDEEGTTKVTGCGRMEVDAWSEEDVESRNTDEAHNRINQTPALNCCSLRCTATFSIIEIESLQTMFKSKNQRE